MMTHITYNMTLYVLYSLFCIVYKVMYILRPKSEDPEAIFQFKFHSAEFKQEAHGGKLKELQACQNPLKKKALHVTYNVVI